jgi:hypothetical protein
VKDKLSFKPEPFQVIKTAQVPVHKVDDNGAAVQNQPAFVGDVFFPVLEGYIFFGQEVEEVSVEALHVSLACYGAYDEAVGKRGLLSDVKGDGVLPFVFLYGVGDAQGKLPAIYSSVHQNPFLKLR